MRKQLTSQTWGTALFFAAATTVSGCGGGPPDVSNPMYAAINDTGVSTCIDSQVQQIGCQSPSEQSELYGQDGNFGRDAKARMGALEKVGAGSGGFDFSKIGAAGEPLAEQGQPWAETGLEGDGTHWSCVTDHVTGLTWEVKTTDPTDMRYKDLTLSWYDSNQQTNGGAAGERGELPCNGIALCDTEAYLEALNSQALCGRTNWRLAQVTELLSIADQSQTNPPLDTDYFPNSSFNAHWTSQSVASDPSQAWYVYFTAAGNGSINKTGRAHIRAVSSDF